LAQPERPPGGTHGAFPGNGEERPHAIPIHRFAIRSTVGHRLMPEFVSHRSYPLRGANIKIEIGSTRPVQPQVTEQKAG
jgi:hypothetical protein